MEEAQWAAQEHKIKGNSGSLSDKVKIQTVRNTAIRRQQSKGATTVEPIANQLKNISDWTTLLPIATVLLLQSHASLIYCDSEVDSQYNNHSAEATVEWCFYSPLEKSWLTATQYGNGWKVKSSIGTSGRGIYQVLKRLSRNLPYI